MPIERRVERRPPSSAVALLLAIAVAVAVTVAGCQAAPPAEPGGPCAATAGREGDICQKALTLAEASLGIHAPITSTRFRMDMCPPNARCAFGIGAQGWVIFTFAFGPPRMVFVAPPDPVDDQSVELVARGPEPLPDWLLEELGLDGER